MFFLICITYPRQDESPDGRAERRGTPQLQTKLDPNCLYENMILCIYMAFPQVQGWPDGRAQRRGVPELQPKFNQICLYESVVFRIHLTFVKQKIKARAPSGRSPLPFWVRAWGPQLWRAGRARARARALSTTANHGISLFFKGNSRFDQGKSCSVPRVWQLCKISARSVPVSKSYDQKKFYKELWNPPFQNRPKNQDKIWISVAVWPLSRVPCLCALPSGGRASVLANSINFAFKNTCFFSYA